MGWQCQGCKTGWFTLIYRAMDGGNLNARTELLKFVGGGEEGGNNDSRGWKEKAKKSQTKEKGESYRPIAAAAHQKK